MRKAYREFIKENKSFWMWFNMIIALCSIGFGVGTYFILDSEETSCSMMTGMLWIVIVLHFVNMCGSLANLSGLEKKICS